MKNHLKTKVKNTVHCDPPLYHIKQLVVVILSGWLSMLAIQIDLFIVSQSLEE